MVLQLLIWFLFGITLLIVSINDFLFFRIENGIVVFLLSLYAVSCVFGVSGGNFTQGISLAIGMLIVTCVLNRLNMIGGGDVKLLFPLLLFSESNIYQFIIGVSVSGVLLSVIYALFASKILFFRKRMISWLCIFYKEKKEFRFLKIVLPSLSKVNRKSVSISKYPKSALKQEIPYGIALSCGGLCVITEVLLSRC